VVLYAGTRGYLDKVPVADVKRWEGEVIDVFRSRNRGLLDDIRTTGKLDEDALKAALDSFNEAFVAGDQPGGQAEEIDPGKADLSKAGGRPEGILPEDQVDRTPETEA
jgi:F-type H+-transporting ATPase subunit alpha